jgi:hypothetical protein
LHLIDLIEENLMKRTSLAVLMIALAILALAAPLAYAQAPAPKVSITGFIDNVTSYSNNIDIYNSGVLNRHDSMWYARTRGRFDIIGEVGKAKAVLGLELDATYGQAGRASSNFTNGGGATSGAITPAVESGFGTDGGFMVNTDMRALLEVKWLYVEFPVPLIPVPTTARLGAQPFGTASTYKLCAFTCSDFSGVNITSQVTPNVQIQATYVQIEENLTGTGSKTNFPFATNGAVTNLENRGDDYAWIISPAITPFKGLDLKPMFSQTFIQGTTNGNVRQGIGGLGSSTAFQMPGGTSGGGIKEYRYTVGLDTRLRMGPFSLDPTVMYQFGNRNAFAPAAFAPSGAITGKKYNPDINAWFVDVRGGFQLGPLLLEALAMYTTGNSSRNNALGSGTHSGTIRYYQPLTTDTGYLTDWGTNLTSLGVDYLNAWNEAGTRVPYPGVSIGYDKYGRMQFGFKATYAITPALSVSGLVDGVWTAEKVDRNSIPQVGNGILPNFTGPQREARYLGTELNALISWRFADGLSWDNQVGYLIPGKALDVQTDPTLGPRNTKDPYMLTSRVRFSF